MPRVVGIDHLVLSVGDFGRSKAFYGKLLGFLGFKLKNSYRDMAGWSNGKTLFWIAEADAQGKTRKYRRGDIGSHHYAFELASRKGVDCARRHLEQRHDGGRSARRVLRPLVFAVYFTDPDGMKLEGMVYKPPPETRARKKKKKEQSTLLTPTATRVPDAVQRRAVEDGACRRVVEGVRRKETSA